MNDIQKLNSIISSLEDQARQVTEFSGLLSAVNEARMQFEASQEQLQIAINEQKDFVTENRTALGRLEMRVDSLGNGFEEFGRNQANFMTENRNTLGRLEARIEALHMGLEEFGRRQAKIADSISSLDILSPRAFSERISESEKTTISYLTKLEKRLEIVVAIQANVQRNFKILLFLSIAAVFGTVVFSFVK